MIKKTYTRGKQRNTFRCLAVNTWTTDDGNDDRALEADASVTSAVPSSAFLVQVLEQPSTLPNLFHTHSNFY